MRISMVLCAAGIAVWISGAGANAAEDSPVTLGAVYGITGEWSGFDVPAAHGAELYVKLANDNGGVLGRPLRVIIRDSGSVSEDAGTATDLLIAENPEMPAVFGLSASDPARAAGKAAAAASRIFLTSGATSPKLPDEVPIWLFLACFGDNVQAAAAAEYAFNELKARSVSVVFDDRHTYTRLLHTYFVEAFKALGGEVHSLVEFTDVENLANVTGGISPADVIFLATETPEDAVAGVRTLRARGLTQPILGGDGYDGERNWSQDPGIADVYFATHAYFGGDHPSPEVRAFREKYLAEYGAEPSAFAGLGYDAAGLLSAAINKAGTTEIDAVLGALSMMQGYEGVTGTISYEDGSRVPSKSVTILRVADGKRHFVKQFVPRHVPSP